MLNADRSRGQTGSLVPSFANAKSEEYPNFDAAMVPMPEQPQTENHSMSGTGGDGAAHVEVSDGVPLWRASLRSLVQSTVWQGTILFLIVANTVTLAMEEPNISADIKSFLMWCDWIFLISFTVEAIVSIVAWGFITKEVGYFRSGWNILDFVVVVIGWATIQSSNGLTALRALRVLRPLRSINKVQGMKVIVEALISSLPMLWNATLLLLFFLFCFSILGLQLWNGTYHRRCYMLAANGTRWALDEAQYDQPCGPRGGLAWECVNDTWCLEPGSDEFAKQNMACHNPVPPHICPYRDDVLNFDNIGYSLLVIFKVDPAHPLLPLFSLWVFPLVLCFVPPSPLLHPSPVSPALFSVPTPPSLRVVGSPSLSRWVFSLFSPPPPPSVPAPPSVHFLSPTLFPFLPCLFQGPVHRRLAGGHAQEPICHRAHLLDILLHARDPRQLLRREPAAGRCDQ